MKFFWGIVVGVWLAVGTFGIFQRYIQPRYQMVLRVLPPAAPSIFINCGPELFCIDNDPASPWITEGGLLIDGTYHYVGPLSTFSYQHMWQGEEKP